MPRATAVIAGTGAVVGYNPGIKRIGTSTIDQNQQQTKSPTSAAAGPSLHAASTPMLALCAADMLPGAKVFHDTLFM